MKNYLEFEKEIKALEQEVEGLKSPFGSEGISEVDTQKIKNTQNEINEKLKETYANLNSWQRTQVARHEDRPRANYYIKKIFSKFTFSPIELKLAHRFGKTATSKFLKGISVG